MHDRNAHLTDEELLLAADGEVSEERIAEIRQHLADCWPCRARQHELETAAVEFVRTNLEALNPLLPAADAVRAQLQARLKSVTPAAPPVVVRSPWAWPAAAAAALLFTVGVGALYLHRRAADRPVYAPSHKLTPGVARAVDRDQLCNSELPKNQVVTADMRRRVFQVYGISGADPRAYEVDYLITPALGGADDIRNLWPQSYVATAWNARVKDSLEDRLRDLVCGGQLDLAEAQRDISADWIAAYKKYFGTDVPPAGQR